MDEILKKEVNERIVKIQEYLNLDGKITTPVSVPLTIDKYEIFKKYYFDHVADMINSCKDSYEIRDEFIQEYPLSRIESLSLEEYALGKENSKDTLSYKIEFGKYKGFIGIGGSPSNKHGIYWGNSGELILNGEVVPTEEIEIKWKEFISQLYNFLKEYEVLTSPIKATEKYPLLKGMPQVLTKLLFLYYPDKFLSIASRGNLIELFDYFEIDFNSNMKSDELNFNLYSELKKIYDFANTIPSQVLGNILWNFIKDVIENENNVDVENVSTDISRIQGGYNKIFYGVPGTGKSYFIDQLLKDEKNENVFRITFHPEYTYNDFIGQLLPTVTKGGEHDGEITYKFQKGPFTVALEKAYNSPSEKVYLIIEEMSRGNCAAIFGDIFQLLDRNKYSDEDNGIVKDESTYSIFNEIISKDILQIKDGKIKIPSNMYILGTVNTSDQNVFVMDTAFKRRFEWEYVSTKPKLADDGIHYKNNATIRLNDGEDIIEVEWINLFKTLNMYISSSDKLGLGEDKQIGQFFIIFDGNDDNEKIKNKLLHYLWFDVQESTYKSEIKLFDDSITCFSDLYESFSIDKKIFSNDFFECLKNIE